MFNELADFEAAAKAHGDAIFGDVPNFTDIAPQVQISEVIAEA